MGHLIGPRDDPTGAIALNIWIGTRPIMTRWAQSHGVPAALNFEVPGNLLHVTEFTRCFSGKLQVSFTFTFTAQQVLCSVLSIV